MIDIERLTGIGSELGKAMRLDDGFRVEAIAGTDAFAPPDGGPRIDRLAGLRFQAPVAPASIIAKVAPTFAAPFDAGAMMLRTNRGAWAKLAFEQAPDGRTMAVSVVTRETSDDANGPVFDLPALYLRIHLAGQFYALHVSADGERWDMLRLFALPGDADAVDFIAQSPTGNGSSAVFSALRLVHGPIADLRDGS